MIKLLQTVNHLLEEGEDLVLATIISHAGSTPRSVGTKMVVRRNGTIVGTIGGGLVEAETLKLAREVFKTARAQVKTTELMGATAATTDQMICGGRLMILLEYLAANPQTIREIRDLIAVLQKGRKGYLLKSLQIGPEAGRTESFLIQNGEIMFGSSLLSEAWFEDFAPKGDEIRYPFIMVAENQSFFYRADFRSGNGFSFRGRPCFPAGGGGCRPGEIPYRRPGRSGGVCQSAAVSQGGSDHRAFFLRAGLCRPGD